jgi:hypothetical protein
MYIHVDVDINDHDCLEYVCHLHADIINNREALKLYHAKYCFALLTER